MKLSHTLATVALAATMAISSAQFVTDMSGSPASSSKPWTDFKLPKKTMKLDFRNANPDMVLSLFTKTSGVTIVKDPSLTQPLSLTTAKAVPLSEAFEILSAALSVRNFELKKEGSLLVIRAKPRQQGRGGFGGGGATGGFDMSQIGDMMRNMGNQGGQNQLKVYPIKFAAASSVARVINEVFANQQANSGLGGFPMMFQMGGQRGGRGGNPFASMFQQGGQGLMVRASADDFSNSVIVNAPSNQQKDVEEFIKQIDKETEQPLKPAVYKLNFAAATDLQATVQNLLIANQPKGRGSGTGGSNNIDQRFSLPFFGGGQNNRQQQALVSADTRTNSLIVTTTEDNQKLVAQVIKDLDTEVKVETSTFVFPLDNARADDIASILQNTFGTRNGRGGGNNRNAGTTNRNNQNRNNQNRNNQNRNNNQFGGGLGAEEIPINFRDPDVDSGELETLVAAQGGFFQFGGFQNQNNQNRQGAGQLTGRDANGRLIPVQDPTNQVTVIPDPNTNSIIVVTSPEYADIIRSILGQLDKIPEQVMIETMIVEASLDAESKLGVEWQFTQDKAFGSSGVTGTAATRFGVQSSNPEGFRYTLAGGQLGAFMNALQSDDKFQVLSTPRIFTSNNVEAQINISQRVPFVTSQRTDTLGNITYTYDFEDVGIVLTVTPRITSNGYVTMDVSQTANDLQGFTSFNAPIVNQRQADTTVAVKDGDTIILGGIIRSTVTSTVKKIPLLGDIPFLGNLFKSTDKKNSKTELLVFLTPRVVRNPDDAAKLREQEQKKLSPESQKAIQKTIGGEIPQSAVKKTGGGN